MICPERRRYEPYSWCNLSDNICIEHTGNSDFDVECTYNGGRDESSDNDYVQEVL